MDSSCNEQLRKKSKSKKGTKVNNFNEQWDQILSINRVANDKIVQIILYSVFDDNNLYHKFLDMLKQMQGIDFNNKRKYGYYKFL